MNRVEQSKAATAVTMPLPTAPAAAWAVSADQLEASGDPRGRVISLQLALAQKPEDAKLRAAERAALADLLTGPLADAFERLDALVAKLRADAGVVVSAYVKRPPVTEQEIAEVEHAIKAPLHPAILTFFRQSNGVQFYADRRDRKGFVEVAVDTNKPAAAISKLRQNFQRSYGLDIPSLREVFLTDVVDQLALEVEPMTFGDEEFPPAFVRTLRLLDKHNPYHPVCAALFERPGNPRIGAGDDYGVTFDATRVTDFETFITTFLKEGGLRERMEAFFRA